MIGDTVITYKVAQKEQSALLDDIPDVEEMISVPAFVHAP